MARSAPSFSSFSAGEITPLLEGRTGIEKYKEGLADLTNMIVMPTGGTKRRPGTEFIGEVKSSAVKTRLIPFQFKTTDTYVLEFGNEIMRVFRNDAQVLNATAKNITAATKASPGVLTSNSHGFSNGDEIFITAISGMTELNGRNYRVANTATNTFSLTDLFGVAINTSSFTTYSSGGTATEIFEIATPYPEAKLPDVRFVQSADTMYFCHPEYAIRTLTRSDHNNWSFATPSIGGSPSPALNTSGNYPSVVTFFEQRLVYGNTLANPQTMWFSKNADYNNFTVGTGAGDALIYTIASNTVDSIRYFSPTRVLTVGTTGGEYVVTATSDGPVTPTTTLIRKYSNYGTANVEPVQVADVTLFLQRGARKVREFKFVGDVNQSGYAAPDMTILAEHISQGGITQFAYQQEPESIVWALRSDGTLLGLTYRREEEVVGWHKHIIGGEFGPATVTVSDYANIAVGSTITITKASGAKVVFTSETAGASAPTDTVLGWRPHSNNNTTADNIFTRINAHPDFTVANPSAAVVTIQETLRAPTGYIKVASNDATRLAVTSESQAVVESIMSLPTDTGNDSVYLIVKRTIGGVTKRYVEVLKPFDFGSVTTAAFFVDCGLAYSGTSTTSLSGLYHLEGQTVSLLANGATHPEENVSGGGVTLDYSSTTAAVGYAYNSEMRTMRIESGSEDGTSMGKPKRIHAVTLRLFETVGIEVGNSATEIDRIPFRDSSMLMDNGIPLFTGDKTIEFPGGFDADRIYVRQSQVLPMTVLAFYPRMNTFDI